MSQLTREQRAQVAFYVSLSALGGLLAVPAVIGYMAYLPISVGTAVLAWRLWSPPLRLRFLVLAGGALVAGLLLHLLPHTRDGGLDGVGLPLCLVATVVVLGGAWRMIKAEAALAKANGGPGHGGES